MEAVTTSFVAFETALGICAVGWVDDGIASVRLPSPSTAALPAIADVPSIPAAVRSAIDGIIGVLDGRPIDLGFVELDERRVEPFRRKVYAATRAVHAGATVTYGQIARAIGRTDPEAPRDVGAALARNPFPIVVPCHRVVGANGKLTGFSAPGGLATKRRMLELEGAPGFGQQLLFG